MSSKAAMRGGSGKVLMSGEKTVRREFFKVAGRGGVAFAGMATEARAQNPALSSANPGATT